MDLVAARGLDGRVADAPLPHPRRTPRRIFDVLRGSHPTLLAHRAYGIDPAAPGAVLLLVRPDGYLGTCTDATGPAPVLAHPGAAMR
jgi:hypothetical protein